MTSVLRPREGRTIPMLPLAKSANGRSGDSLKAKIGMVYAGPQPITDETQLSSITAAKAAATRWRRSLISCTWLLQRGNVLLGPRARVEDILAARTFEVDVERFVERDSITSTAKRFAKIIAVAEERSDGSGVCAHPENHRHCFIHGQVVEPAIADAKRGERGHRQRDVVRQFLAEFAQKVSIKLAFGKRSVEIDL